MEDIELKVKKIVAEQLGIKEEDIKNMEKLIDLLEENDDVQNVWHNWQQD